jgi:TetR/AcrR family transcriptional repressor of nem operon
MLNPNQLMMSEATIDKVMVLFLEKGYLTTSIQDLAAITGINRAALYKHFGGKQGLFHLMLQRFRNKVVVDAVEPLNNPARGMEGIKTFFTQFTQCHLEMQASHGCFMMAIAANLPQHEPEAVRAIEEFIYHLRALIYKNLRWQQIEKLLDADFNTEITADFLVGNVVGLMTLVRSSADPRILQNHVASIIQYISTLPVRRSAPHNNLHLIT